MSNLSTASTPAKRVISKSLARKMRIAGMLEAYICGIPCLIDVLSCDVVKGNYSSSAVCKEEYEGYADVEFDVYDRKGYRAAWLEFKMTDLDKEAIEEMIINSSKG